MPVELRRVGGEISRLCNCFFRIFTVRMGRQAARLRRRKESLFGREDRGSQSGRLVQSPSIDTATSLSVCPLQRAPPDGSYIEPPSSSLPFDLPWPSPCPVLLPLHFHRHLPLRRHTSASKQIRTHSYSLLSITTMAATLVSRITSLSRSPSVDSGDESSSIISSQGMFVLSTRHPFPFLTLHLLLFT